MTTTIATTVQERLERAHDAARGVGLLSDAAKADALRAIVNAPACAD